MPQSIHAPLGASLRTVRPYTFALKLAVLVLLTTIGLIGVVMFPYPLKIPFQIVIGAMFVHAVELAHQCIHMTAFGHKRYKVGVDHRVGRLFCLPMGVSFVSYCVRHLWHHGHNGTELDSESFDYRYGKKWRLRDLLRHCSMFDHYRTTVTSMAYAVAGKLPEKLKSMPNWKPRYAQDIQSDYRRMAVILVVAVIISFVFHTLLLVNAWLIPLLFVAGPLHALIELPEHYDCSKPTDNVFRNTRSIDAGPFLRWLTNYNNYHVGHHSDMLVIPERLGQYEQQLRQGHTYEYLEESYLAFYRRVFHEILASAAH